MGTVAHDMVVEEFYSNIVADLYFDRCYGFVYSRTGGVTCVCLAYLQRDGGGLRFFHFFFIFFENRRQLQFLVRKVGLEPRIELLTFV